MNCASGVQRGAASVPASARPQPGQRRLAQGGRRLERCFKDSRPQRRAWTPLAVAGEAPAAPAAAGAAAAADAPPAAPTQNVNLVYRGIVFDMDGTLTVSNIDYAMMRAKTQIPVGDLFTVMESWDDGDRIKRSMDVILQLEAQASAALTPQPGLPELLAFLRSSGVKVGLVTRNTTESLDAFFGAVGEGWRDVFDVCLTRDNTPYVKPDPRSLLHFAEAWGMQPYELLMVGDSLEDIETANAAGTASCMIAGGGNETAAGAEAPAPPLGAVPTFTVDSLAQLQRRLAECNTALGWGAYGDRALSLSSSTFDEDDDDDFDGTLLSALPGTSSSLAGAPPKGLDFLDALFEPGTLQAASCSFPRIDGARFGVPPDAHPGDRVLHLGCGNGSLTKLLFSRGLQVIGIDEDMEAAARRGLPAVQLRPLELRQNALQPELSAMGGKFDAVVFYARTTSSASGSSSRSVDGEELTPPQQAGLAATWWRPDSLAEIRRVLKPGGKLCVQAPLADEPAARQQLAASGFRVATWERTIDGAARVVASA